MYWGRKADDKPNASNAAVLVVLIALLIVLYILMLPPETRNALLGENGTASGGGPSGERDVLLSFVPQAAGGPDREQSKPLPVFTLKTQTEGNVLAERSGVTAERSVFHEETDTLRFRAPDNSQNVLLSFSVSQALGRLQVALNGQRIYDSAIQRRQPEPIAIPAQRLSQENELTFGVSDVGFSFWRTNRYVLSNVMVTADVTSFARASHEQQFVVQDTDSVRAAQVAFLPDCFEQQGRLTLDFNGETVYSGFPACGVPVRVDLAPSRLSPVQNTLEWSVAEGEYIVDQVEVLLQREVPANQGRFSLTSRQLNELVASGTPVSLALSFAGQGAEGTVVVNGEPLRFRTAKQSFSAPITEYVRAGTNTVEVRGSSTPVTLLEVRAG